MALSTANSANTYAPNYSQHTHSSKFDVTTEERLRRQGFLSGELILRVSQCVKCDSLSSCPGMLYVSTEQIYFVSMSTTHDIGQLLSIVQTVKLTLIQTRIGEISVKEYKV